MSTFNFTVAPHLEIYNRPRPEFAACRPEFTDFVTGAHIFSVSKGDHSTPRVLLLQRSFSDSFGGAWEGPGGLCEDTDATLLEGVAREVLEESGLHVSRFVELVSVDGWVNVKPGGVRRAAKYTFIVDVHEQGADGWEGGVQLDEQEHQAFVWVTEDELREASQSGKYSFVGLQGRNFLAGFDIMKRL